MLQKESIPVSIPERQGPSLELCLLKTQVIHNLKQATDGHPASSLPEIAGQHQHAAPNVAGHGRANTLHQHLLGSLPVVHQRL